jgi:hypothetical protein
MSDNVIPRHAAAGHTPPAAPPAPAAMATPAWMSTTTEPLRAALSGLDQPHIGPATTVWPTRQQPDAAQRAGRYLPKTLRHPQRTLPTLAAHATDRYTQPGQTVYAPFAGSGTIPVEAIHAGRRAIGTDINPRRVELTAANVMFAQQHGATGEALLAEEDARDLGAQPRWLRGRVDLVATPPARLSPTDNPARRWSNADIVDQLEWDLALCLDAVAARRQHPRVRHPTGSPRWAAAGPDRPHRPRR